MLICVCIHRSECDFWNYCITINRIIIYKAYEVHIKISGTVFTLYIRASLIFISMHAL